MPGALDRKARNKRTQTAPLQQFFAGSGEASSLIDPDINILPGFGVLVEIATGINVVPGFGIVDESAT